MGLNTVLPSNRGSVNGRELAVVNPSTRGHDDTSLLIRIEGYYNRLDEERLPSPSDFPTVSHSPQIAKQKQKSDKDRLNYSCHESNFTSFSVTPTNSLSWIADLGRNQNQSVTRGRRTHHSVSNRTSSAASVSFPRSLLCMTRYMYSAVAALIYPAVSHLDKVGAS